MVNFGFDRLAYEKLCRNEIKKTSQLYCRYINYDYQLLIGPIKEELINEDPPIWIYHDVISDKQIEMMKTLAMSNVTDTLFISIIRFFELFFVHFCLHI